MLDKMREGSQGVAAKAVLIVIILSFALAGVSSYLTGGNTSVAVVVNNQEISQGSIEQAYNSERSSLQQQYGEQFELLAANPNFAQQVRAQATQKLISKTLFNQAISEMGLRVGDEQVKSEIRQMEEFMVDGKFDNERYLSMLRRASYTPANFSIVLKEDLTRRQLSQVLSDSEFVMPQEVVGLNQLQAQQRIAKVLKVAVADFEAGIEISEADIQTYYENNAQSFQYPEQVSADYILLEGATLADRVTITPEELETYFDQHQSDYMRAERRKVAHILVNGDDEASQQKAEGILAELKAGADFNQLVADNSDDTFSAKNNGELPLFERGVNEASFDDAAFSLTKEVPVSDVVKTKFGYHIIKLIEIEEGAVSTFSEVKAQVEVALKQEKMDELYYELQQELGEVAFESPDSLDEAAETISATIMHTELFSKQNAPESLANKTVLDTLFNVEFRDEGLNSDVIELSENKAIVVRANEYKKPTVQPLSEVSDVIVTQLRADRAQAKAQEFVNSLMAKLDANESIDDLLTDKGIEFSDDLTLSRYSRDQDYQVIEKAFKMPKPAEEQVSYDSATTSEGDFVVIKLEKIVDALEADESMEVQLTQILARSESEATYQAFISQLMADADIQYANAE